MRDKIEKQILLVLINVNLKEKGEKRVYVSLKKKREEIVFMRDKIAKKKKGEWLLGIKKIRENIDKWEPYKEEKRVFLVRDKIAKIMTVG